MGLTKEQIEEFLEIEKEACDTWDYLDLATDYLSIDKSYSDDALNKAENLAESFMDFTCLVEFYLEQENIDKSKVADYCLKAEKLAESFSDFTDLARFYFQEGNIDKSKAKDYCLKAENLAESSRDFTNLAQFYCQEGNIDKSKAKDYCLKALKKSANNLPDSLSVFNFVQRNLKDDEFAKDILLTCEKTIEKSHHFEDIMSRLSGFIHDIQKFEDEVLTSNTHNKIIDIFTEVIKDNTLNGEKQNFNVCFSSSLISDMNNCFETILRNIYDPNELPNNKYTEVSKRWIHLLLELEQKSTSTYDFRDLGCMAVRRYTPSIDGENTTAKSLANGWFEKGISVAEDIESLESLYTEMTCEGWFSVSDELKGKIAGKILEIAKTFNDFQSIVVSDYISELSIDGTPISETAMDMAIKLKGEATEDELEEFICHLEEYDLSDRIDELK
jgi:hypothetical protein